MVFIYVRHINYGYQDEMGIRISFPLVLDPLAFETDETYNCMGKIRVNSKSKRRKRKRNKLEKITEDFFAGFIEERQEIEKSRAKFRDVDINFLRSKFPSFSEVEILVFRSQFQTFDVNQDCVIDFMELCRVLNDLGDTSSNETRKTYFDIVDEDGSNAIDFVEFLKFMDIILNQTETEFEELRTELTKRGLEKAERLRMLSIPDQMRHGLF